jgi:hypothetical protein
MMTKSQRKTLSVFAYIWSPESYILNRHGLLHTHRILRLDQIKGSLLQDNLSSVRNEVVGNDGHDPKAMVMTPRIDTILL